MEHGTEYIYMIYERTCVLPLITANKQDAGMSCIYREKDSTQSS